MSRKRRSIRVVIDGADLTPETMRASELAGYLEKIEAAVTSLLGSNPDEQMVAVSLVGITAGSERLDLSVDPDAYPAAQTIQNAIAEERVEKLPFETQQYLHELSKGLLRRGRAMTFGGARGRKKARISQANPVKKPTRLFTTGQTTLFGYLFTAGGKEPGFKLQLDDGSSISCRTSRPLAKKLGARLYSVVGLKGTATWDATTWRIEAFDAEDVLPFHETPVDEAFRALRETLGGSLDQLDSVEFVRDLRGRE